MFPEIVALFENFRLKDEIADLKEQNRKLLEQIVELQDELQAYRNHPKTIQHDGGFYFKW